MKIIAIVGPSGAGKDTVAVMLSSLLGYEILCSYTTRPIREGEVDDREHHFVKECPYLPEDKNILAYTRYGDYEYWTEVSQVEGAVIYVIDEKGLMNLMEKFPKAEIIAIYVSAKTETIRKRGISYERTDRDHYRVQFDINDFDFVIPNNRSMFHLWDHASFVAKKIREQEIGVPCHDKPKG